MKTVQLAASALMTAILLIVVVILWEPSFALPSTSRTAGLGAGALPQFSILAIAVLSIGSLIRDIVSYRRSGAIAGPIGAEEDERSPRRVVIMGIGALALLAVYLLAWFKAGFLMTTLAVLIVASALLAPKKGPRELGIIAITNILFGLLTWAVFTHVLNVPLR